MRSIPSLSMKVFLRSPGFMLSSFYWRNLGRTKPAAPRAWGFKLADCREGRRIALLLALEASNALLLDEVTEGSAHLLSGDAKLRSHLLIGDRSILLPQSVEDVLTELRNLLVHLGLAGTSSRTHNLVNLLLAESDDLGVVSHSDGDAGVEVLLSGLSLGHDLSPFLGLASLCPLRVPFDSFFFWGGHPLFLYLLYHIFVYFVKHFLLDLFTFCFTNLSFFPSFSLFFNYIITYFSGCCQYVIF